MIQNDNYEVMIIPRDQVPSTNFGQLLNCTMIEFNIKNSQNLYQISI